jgi:hypothetical protein
MSAIGWMMYVRGSLLANLARANATHSSGLRASQRCLPRTKRRVQICLNVILPSSPFFQTYQT